MVVFFVHKTLLINKKVSVTPLLYFSFYWFGIGNIYVYHRPTYNVQPFAYFYIPIVSLWGHKTIVE